MICPAILDPFQGSNYRLTACLHQALLCPIVAKTFSFLFAPTIDSCDEEPDVSADGNYKYITGPNNQRIKVRSLESMIYKEVDKQK